MADERIFKVKIDGLDKSYKDTVKLLDVLNSIKDVNARVSVETDKVNKSTAESTNRTREKTKALTEEEKAEKKLEQTLARRRQLDTQVAREQINANQALRERTQQLSRSIQLENASSGSIDEKRLQIGSLAGAYRALSDEERNSAHIGGAMLNQIQEMRAEYNELERSLGNHAVNVGNYESATAGLSGTLEKLGGQVSATAENTKGMLSMFQAGVGIALMFDDKNSTLQKTMNSLGKTMAIVGALQQANNILLTKGALASKGSAIMEGIHALQIRARASAIALSTKNTVLATVAQSAFNVVANLNPYVLLAVALITVIGALVAFSSGTETASEKQKRLNDLINDSIQLKDQYASKLKNMSDASVNEMQRELDLMKARGASESQLALKQKQIYEEKLKNAEKMKGYYKDEIDSIGENSRLVDKYTSHLDEMNKRVAQAIKDGKERLKYKFQGVEYNVKLDDKSIEDAKTKLETGLNTVTVKLKQGLVAKEEVDEATNDLDKFTAETNKKYADAGKRSALALAEYRVLIAKKGSQEELTAQIASANQRLKNDLSNADITKGEILKKTEETLKEITKLESDYRKSQIQDSIALTDALLSVTKKGSLEEYNLRAERLLEQKKIDLENADLTANQRLAIENKYQDELKTLTDDRVRYVAEVESETTISSINERLSKVAEGSQEELNLRVDLAKENARIAKEDIENSIDDEKLKAQRIKEINANLQQEIRGLNVNNDISSNDRATEKETLAIVKQLEARKISKQKYERAMIDLSISALQEEIKIRKKYGQDTTKLEADLSELRITQAENEKNKISSYFEEMHQNLQETLGNIMQGVSAIFDGVNAVFQAQLDDANEKYEAISVKYDEVVAKREESSSRIEELEEQAKNARGGRSLMLQEQINSEMEANRQLANQEKQLAKEKEKLEKDIAKKEKQMKKAQILSDMAQGGVNTALAITSALTVKPFPLGVILAGIAGAMGAVQLGVMSKQLSKLEDGGLLNGNRHSHGGMRVEGTNIEVEGGEYVVNRESTSKNLGLMHYINSQRRELAPSDINSFFSKSSQGFEPPFKRIFEDGGQLPNINTVSVDSSLIEAIQSIKIEPRVSVTDINKAQNGLVKTDNMFGM